MICFPDWPERLARFVHSRRGEPFVWGKHDCCLFACDAVLEITGVDLAAGFRGKYDSALKAMRVMKDFSGGGVEQVAEKIAQTNGIEEIPVLMAQRGDVVYLGMPENPGLGIVGLSGHAVHAAGPIELVDIQISDLTDARAWRIPKA